MSIQAIDTTRSEGERGGGGLQKERPHFGKDSDGYSDEKKDTFSPIWNGGFEETFLGQDGIPEELRGRQFQDIDALHDELDRIDLPDCKFILNDEGFVTMPGDEHNGGTRFIRRKLYNYIKGWRSDWGFVDGDNSQEINRLTPSGKQARREPNVNLWLPEKCELSGKLMKVRKRPGTKVDVDPDVFFQFSWGNSETNEIQAMNDLLTLGGFSPGNPGPPRVGVLVKVRRERGKDVGIDVYKVFSGRTVADAILGNHAAMNTTTMRMTPTTTQKSSSQQRSLDTAVSLPDSSQTSKCHYKSCGTMRH